MSGSRRGGGPNAAGARRVRPYPFTLLLVALVGFILLSAFLGSDQVPRVCLQAAGLVMVLVATRRIIRGCHYYQVLVALAAAALALRLAGWFISSRWIISTGAFLTGLLLRGLLLAVLSSVLGAGQVTTP